MVNGLIKITPDYQVDFTFIDKVISNIVGIDRTLLHSALSNIQFKKSESKKKKSKSKSKERARNNSLDMNSIKEQTNETSNFESKNMTYSISPDR